MWLLHLLAFWVKSSFSTYMKVAGHVWTICSLWLEENSVTSHPMLPLLILPTSNVWHTRTIEVCVWWIVSHLCVFVCVQEYVRLIGPWCQVNIGSCRFMLGQCYLANGEGQKVGHQHYTCRSESGEAGSTHWLCGCFQALQCFQEAATEVEKEEFLIRLTGTEEEEAASTPRLQYYNKVHTAMGLGGQKNPITVFCKILAATRYSRFFWSKLIHWLWMGPPEQLFTTCFSQLPTGHWVSYQANLVS